MPTVVEAGYPKLQSPFWLGVVAPTGTPAEIVDKLNHAFRDAMNDPAARSARCSAKLGAERSRSSRQEDFRKMLAAELALWSDVVKDANIKVE